MYLSVLIASAFAFDLLVELRNAHQGVIGKARVGCDDVCSLISVDDLQVFGSCSFAFGFFIEVGFQGLRGSVGLAGFLQQGSVLRAWRSEGGNRQERSE